MDFQIDLTPFRCPICFEFYDNDQHAPVSFLCGHSCCLHHADSLRECHECRGVIPCLKDLSPNYSLRDCSVMIVQQMKTAKEAKFGPKFEKQPTSTLTSEPAICYSESNPRQSTLFCKYFNSPRGCNYGNLCRFKHEHNDIKPTVNRHLTIAEGLTVYTPIQSSYISTISTIREEGGGFPITELSPNAASYQPSNYYAHPTSSYTQLPCVVCGAASTTTCNKCKVAVYCCKDHQVQDFKKHKRQCVMSSSSSTIPSIHSSSSSSSSSSPLFPTTANTAITSFPKELLTNSNTTVTIADSNPINTEYFIPKPFQPPVLTAWSIGLTAEEQYQWFIRCFLLRLNQSINSFQMDKNTNKLYIQHIFGQFLIFCKLAHKRKIIPSVWDWNVLLTHATDTITNNLKFSITTAEEIYGSQNIFNVMLGGSSLIYTAECIYGFHNHNTKDEIETNKDEIFLFIESEVLYYEKLQWRKGKISLNMNTFDRSYIELYHDIDLNFVTKATYLKLNSDHRFNAHKHSPNIILCWLKETTVIFVHCKISKGLSIRELLRIAFISFWTSLQDQKHLLESSELVRTIKLEINLYMIPVTKPSYEDLEEANGSLYEYSFVVTDQLPSGYNPINTEYFIPKPFQQPVFSSWSIISGSHDVSS
eukprot:gene10919-22789_t